MDTCWALAQATSSLISLRARQEWCAPRTIPVDSRATVKSGHDGAWVYSAAGARTNSCIGKVIRQRGFVHFCMSISFCDTVLGTRIDGARLKHLGLADPYAIASAIRQVRLSDRTQPNRAREPSGGARHRRRPVWRIKESGLGREGALYGYHRNQVHAYGAIPI